MQRSTITTFMQLALLVVVSAGIYILTHRAPQDQIAFNPLPTLTAAAIESSSTTTKPLTGVATTSASARHAQEPKIINDGATESGFATREKAVDPVVSRIPNPYSDAPLSGTVINERARAATINILCTTQSGLVRPISGSGVIIDDRGVILTNAHVAQYVLLAQSGRTDLTCVVRTGSPATPRWIPRVMFVPPIWVQEHAHEIGKENVVGTGEHDYALLVITGSVDNTPLPSTFPSLRPDTREAIGFVGDQVVVSSYPAEFLGGIATIGSLYAASSLTTIQKLMTFSTTSIDVISLGGVITAQSGSSGGALVNAWGRLVGLITTMSDAQITSNRDLRAITLSYIHRDIERQSGMGLEEILTRMNPKLAASAFSSDIAPQLIQLILKEATKNR